MQRSYSLVAAMLVVSLLAGCGGLLLLALVGMQAGNLYAQVRDFMGVDSTDYSMVLDGYDLGISPNPNGTLDLRGLPTGTHLLSIVSSNKRIGFHRAVDISSGGRLNLGQINLSIGGVIAGRVERQVGGVRVPLAGVRVAAAFGGANLLAQSTGSSLTFPPETTTPTTIMTFTDANGNYRLGPCEFGSWLLTSAYPGYLTDVTFCAVASGNDASGQNLLLLPDATAAAPATLRGSVVRTGGGPLPNSLVNVDLKTPLSPLLDPARVTALTSQTGITFREQPWFQWRSLATQTNNAGAYNFETPPGMLDLWALKYGFKAKTTSFTVAPAAAKVVDFDLEPR